MRQWNESGAAPITARTGAEITEFSAGPELLDAGVGRKP
jgi:hypothetical protein